MYQAFQVYLGLWLAIAFIAFIDTPNILIGRYNLPVAVHLPPPTPPFLLTYFLICTICDITAVVEKVAQNPAVLASYYRYVHTVVMKHVKDYSNLELPRHGNFLHVICHGSLCHDMKFCLCYLAKDRTQIQNVNITIKYYLIIVFIDDQHPSLGSISVFIITKYNIDSAFSLSYCDIFSCHNIYHYISILQQHYSNHMVNLQSTL